jgi:hypothetical protein
MMDKKDISHVLISPPETLGVSLVKDVASILNKDPYEVRILLAGDIPKIIAHYPNTQEAESIVNRLKNVGVMALVCS